MLEDHHIPLMDVRTKTDVVYPNVSCFVLQKLNRFILHSRQPYYVILAFIITQRNAIGERLCKISCYLLFGYVWI